MKKLSLLLLAAFCCLLSFVVGAQATTNNPGVPIFGSGGTSSGLENMSVNGLGNVVYPANFFTQNSGAIVNSSGATNAQGSRVAFASDVAGIPGADSNAVRYCQLNGSANSTALADLSGMFSAIEANPVVWTNFVDGILFKPRFGTNTTLFGNPIVGQNNVYTPDGYGAIVTNGIKLALPSGLSNVTIVVNYEGVALNSTPSGGMTCALGNTNTGSSIEIDDNGDGLVQLWENYRGTFYNGRVNPTYTNLVQPLWVNNYNYQMLGAQLQEPKIIAFVRDANANWRVYVDSVQGEIGFSTLAYNFQCPTNATDPLNTLYIGTPGVVSSSPNGTNAVVASVFVFSTTNYAAVVAGYKAALWAEDTDTMDILIGDSRQQSSDAQPWWSWGWFYRRKNPRHWYRNYSQGGTKFSSWQNTLLPNGGLAMFTNAPLNKIKNRNLFENFGINDCYGDGDSPSSLFTAATNCMWPYINNGVNLHFIDVYQIASNATSPYTYSLAAETNVWTFNRMVRTNTQFVVNQYIPARDFVTQAMLNTNGPFSYDGLHLYERTNTLFSEAMADLMAFPSPVGALTNGPIGP